MNIPPLRPNGRPFLNHLPHFRADPLNFWLETGQIAPIVRVRLGPVREFWVITDADHLQHILQVKARQYPRADEILGKDKISGAETVFNAPTWDEWLWRRRLLQPAFHRKQLTAFATAMVEEAAQLVSEWDARIALKPQMKTLTMRIIGRTMFSAPLQQTEILQECFEQVTAFSYHQTSTLVKWPVWVPTRLHQRTRWAYKTRFEIVNRLVQARLVENEPQGDLLDMLIAANLEDGRRFSAENIVHEMNSIIFAGHETTAMTLTWFFYLLTQYPAVAEKVYAEIDSVLGDRLPTFADLDAMPYTDWVIQETMRLYPSVYVTLRKSQEDDMLGDVPIPAKTDILVNIRGLHRDKRYWSQPDRFLPDRFADEPKHKFAFMPFLVGPRKCIGDSFAMMEMRLVIPTILQRVRLAYDSAEPVREVAGFVMEAGGDVPMQVEKIEA